MAGQPAQGLLLLVHGTFWPAQLLRRGREREQSARPLQPDGEDAAAMWTPRGQTWRCLDRSVFVCRAMFWCDFFKIHCYVFWSPTQKNAVFVWTTVQRHCRTKNKLDTYLGLWINVFTDYKRTYQRICSKCAPSYVWSDCLYLLVKHLLDLNFSFE